MSKIVLGCFTAAVLTAALFTNSAQAVGMQDRSESRQDRRGDAVENTADGMKDRQEFREERRDCVGEGPDCRQDNRHDRASDSADRAQDRRADKQERRGKRF